jgi:carboxymethylenebutenolidase
MHFIVSLLLFFALLTFAPGASAMSADSFQSDGKTIAIEWYRTQSTDESHARKPVVIILHGSGGVGGADGFFRSIATDFARRGRTALIVHYFDQTGTKAASPADMSKNFSIWIKTIDQALTHCARQPFVDADNMSILGHSLGAQLALHTAARDHRVSAVVDMAGCFVWPAGDIKTMPPVLILHGDADNVVPIAREKALVADLKRIGSHFEEHVFPDGDHAFSKVPFEELMSISEDFLIRNRSRKLHLPKD